MREAVDEVIALRAPDTGGLRQMISWSFAIHVTALVLVAVLPRTWMFRERPKPPVMLSLIHI